MPRLPAMDAQHKELLLWKMFQLLLRKLGPRQLRIPSERFAQFPQGSFVQPVRNEAITGRDAIPFRARSSKIFLIAIQPRLQFTNSLSLSSTPVMRVQNLA